MCALKRPASPHVALVVVQHQGRLHVVGQRAHLQLAEEVPQQQANLKGCGDLVFLGCGDGVGLNSSCSGVARSRPTCSGVVASSLEVEPACAAPPSKVSRRRLVRAQAPRGAHHRVRLGALGLGRVLRRGGGACRNVQARGQRVCGWASKDAGNRLACDRLLLLVLVCGNAAHRCMAACAGAGWFEHPVFGLPGRGVKHIFL